MFKYFKRKKEKAYAKENIDEFDTTIDRLINYDELLNEISAAEELYPTDPAVNKDDLNYPCINPQQNQALIEAARKYVYYPGETVSGSVNLVLRTDIPATELTVQFAGFVVVVYESDDEYKEKIEALYHESVTLWSFGGGSNPMLVAGTYKYDFKFTLPSDMLGTVYYQNSDKEGGLVFYSIDSQLTLAKGGHVSSDESFVPIQRRLYKNEPSVRPELWATSPEQEEKESTGLLGGGGDIIARVTLHPGIYTAEGQDFLFDVHVINKSKKSFQKIKAALVQHVRFRYGGETKYETDKFLSEIKVPVNIRPRDELVLRGLRLPVPVGLEPTLDKHGGSRWANNVAIRYEVQVGVYSGHHWPSPFIVFDNVIIGSRPPGESLDDVYGGFVSPGNFEYKSVKVRVCVPKAFCSALQAVVASGKDEKTLREKMMKKAAKKKK